MPLPDIPKPTYPNVPDAPGVPDLQRSVSVPPDATPSLGSPAASGQLWQASTAQPVWGVFDPTTGNQIVAPDSIVDFDLRGEYEISKYPIQNGGFGSFNKVIIPEEISLRFTKGGTRADRTTMLNAIKAIVASIQTYTVLTPEQTYVDMNATRWQMSRKGAQGAYFVAVDVFFENIIQTTQQYDTAGQSTLNAQLPSAQPATNNGLQATQPITSSAFLGGSSAIANTPQ